MIPHCNHREGLNKNRGLRINYPRFLEAGSGRTTGNPKVTSQMGFCPDCRQSARKTNQWHLDKRIALLSKCL
jgi:hypothetical protein